MKWYLLFAGEDFADHSSGYLYESFDGEEFNANAMVAHAKQCSEGKAWMMLQEVHIDPIHHNLVSATLWEKWEPLKKKIVLDPKKGKAKKSVAQKKAEALEQMNMFFQNNVLVGADVQASPSTITISNVEW